jgi:hypothetical protein
MIHIFGVRPLGADASSLGLSNAIRRARVPTSGGKLLDRGGSFPVNEIGIKPATVYRDDEVPGSRRGVSSTHDGAAMVVDVHSSLTSIPTLPARIVPLAAKRD